ncbi:ubiquitin-associated and SH3 domain-containing protein A [Spea bombifrons]|uniref:ubiquitin-associated and SH3 domain-containing protein A n=1 Tax=Spea bombifrons TaxID=233779 RepID=UPI00234ACCFE|nr:ubiquitin-associated and SH3 domain-containing protein A [Spea bombifrons]
MDPSPSPLYAKVSDKSRSARALLDPLLQMGFAEHHAQKALAATGRRSVQAAADWLRSHKKDPTLDDPIPQEFILYLIPSGPLGDTLEDFWEQSLKLCGWNKAHASFPHMTLCDFFTCEDWKVDSLYRALRRAGDLILPFFPKTISLSLYSSSSFIGFFINEGTATTIRRFMDMFCEEAKKLADCSVKLLSRDFHLTLAHRFSPHHQGTLEHLAKSLCPTQSCEWEAVLFSRDMRFVHCKTLRALFPFKPNNADELKLSPGEVVYRDTIRQPSTTDGWLMAISHRTGCQGMVPENYLEKVKDTATWVKHRSYRFTLSRVHQEVTLGPEDKERKRLESQVHSRSLLIVSHGESVDEVFGPSWLSERTLTKGVYTRTDLNLPSRLPDREKLLDFEWDPPLSSCGTFQARLVGEALLDAPVQCDSVLCSPALRCIQTAHHILKGMQQDHQVKICVDWRLYDWTENNKISTPRFVTSEELEQHGYNMDTANSSPDSTPSPEELYAESPKLRADNIIKRVKEKSG